ncbi:MAG: hypothetical protein GX575_14065 [Candidatus Anammoximicrobium sp.]|nr:hypothetical protein [Candidatus Anammoximicrobium sp.]
MSDENARRRKHPALVNKRRREVDSADVRSIGHMPAVPQDDHQMADHQTAGD